MKRYNKILEAINRGIRFALDDFEDDNIQGQINSKVNNKSNLKEYFEWQDLINKFELKQQKTKDILRLAELSKITGLKYKIPIKRLFDFVKNYVNMQESLYHADLNWIDTSEIYTMHYLFQESKFDGDISEWNVSNVESMYSMFAGSKFNGNISKWNVSNVKDMRYMFQMTPFNQNISNWDVSNVSLFDQAGINRATGMFMHCPIKEEYKPKFNK